MGHRSGNTASGLSPGTVEDERQTEAKTIAKPEAMTRNQGASCGFPSPRLVRPKGRKCLVQLDGYKKVPPRRTVQRRETPERGFELTPRPSGCSRFLIITEIREPDGMRLPLGILPNEDPKICTLNCTLKFEKQAEHVLHVFQRLV
jgi:hypothetical protein